jgi:hypothetical protein
MLADFTMTPFAGFVVGVVVAGAWGLYHRNRHNDVSQFLAALLDRPDLYERIRCGEWQRLHKEAFDRDLAAQRGRRNGG